jgi:cyanophycinase
MAEPDLQALSLAGGPRARISIIPAAAAPDQNHLRAGQNGVNWFQGIGANHVTALPLIDRKSADDPGIVSHLKQSTLIYLLGGFPRHLAESLAGSFGWEATLVAHQSGGVIAGSSAGAMVLCELYYDPMTGQILKGLNLLPGIFVLPHHNTFGKSWASRLVRSLPSTFLLGIDEQTGMLNDGPGGQWQVYGKGAVTLYRGKQMAVHHSRGIFALEG